MNHGSVKKMLFEEEGNFKNLNRFLGELKKWDFVGRNFLVKLTIVIKSFRFLGNVIIYKIV